jgi:ATP-binding cassette subfamily B protein
VRDADQIFVLDRGRIAERGTHDQLVARDGLYAALYKKQLLEEELAAS